MPATPIPQSVWELISAADDKEASKINGERAGMQSMIRLVQERENIPKPERTRGVPGEFSSSHGSYAVDPQLFNYRGNYISLFLQEENLQCGTKVSMNFSNKQKMRLLSRAMVDEIPFSSDKLSLALKELNVAPDSLTALAMKRVLEACERPAVAGKTKYCVTSVESMIDFTTSKLKTNRFNCSRDKCSEDVKIWEDGGNGYLSHRHQRLESKKWGIAEIEGEARRCISLPFYYRKPPCVGGS